MFNFGELLNRIHYILFMGKISSLLFKLVYKVSVGKFKTKLDLLKHGWGLMVSPDSILVQSGYVNSFLSGEAIDIKNEPTPWMNYCLIELLKNRLKRDIKICEYGSGNSTLFFANRVDHVVSIEYDQKWYDLIHLKLKSENLRNVEYVFCSLGENYADKILELDGLFDLVVIDGRQRVNCAITANSKLTNMGVILLDDSNRVKYSEIFKFYSEKGFSHLSFSGLKPLGFGIDVSTIFYRSGQNCFDL